MLCRAVGGHEVLQDFQELVGVLWGHGRVVQRAEGLKILLSRCRLARSLGVMSALRRTSPWVSGVRPRASHPASTHVATTRMRTDARRPSVSKSVDATFSPTSGPTFSLTKHTISFRILSRWSRRARTVSKRGRGARLWTFRIQRHFQIPKVSMDQTITNTNMTLTQMSTRQMLYKTPKASHRKIF